MSSCSRSTNVLSYLLGELDENDKALFEQHIANCPICREELRLERSLQNGLAECTMPDAAPDELRLNVFKTILTVQKPRFPLWQIALTLLSGTAAFYALMQILRDSTLPEAGIGFLVRFVDGIFATIAQGNSLPLMIGTGIVLIGIVSVLASLLPEE
ncbi:MAG: zf-HC2 domain-containing protein [Candidatus Fermentibacteria bacterium]